MIIYRWCARSKCDVYQADFKLCVFVCGSSRANARGPYQIQGPSDAWEVDIWAFQDLGYGYALKGDSFIFDGRLPIKVEL